MQPPQFFDSRLLTTAQESPTEFNEISVLLASPEKIRAWASRNEEVRVAETINYRTFKPEPGGLFCARIFGPVRDFECLCGKFKGSKYKNVICEKCGVEVTHERVRRERMGYINLATPVAHILFFKSTPSRIGVMMNLTMRDIERILYFEAYVVLDPRRVGELERGQVLSMDDYDAVVAANGEGCVSVGIGAEGLRDFLREMDLDAEVVELEEKLAREKKSSPTRTKLTKRLRLVKKFRFANVRPEWMILEALPVLPPNLRPLVTLDGGRFTSSDLNDLYRRVINRNNRLRKLLDINAPDIIINNEKRMLQEAVDSLLDNGRRGKPAVGPNKRVLKSLADAVKGKTGRFRQNLLGKRVDFSARSVIVVGPNLKLHQCGIPKQMALTLFQPFVLNALVREGYVANVKQAKQRLHEPDAETWDVLEKIIHQHPVMLNRAPTLHRLGIQAFEPVLVEGKAIQLHPLPCVAFNADFDGDQMAVHVPLSLEAQAEARVLMLSANNILAPSNGEPITLPTQDIVLGIYCATRERLDAKGTDMRFADFNEVETAFAAGAVELQTRIQVLIPHSRNYGTEASADEEQELVTTTVGRLLMLKFLPERIAFSLINRTLKKKNLSSLVSEIFHTCGGRETVIFCDQLMRFGFEWSTRSGVSICMQDMTIPDEKRAIIDRATQDMLETKQQFDNGLLTVDERYNKSVDLWDKASERVSQAMMDQLSRQELRDPASGKAILESGKPKTQESFNSLYMMADSGARGSQTQIKQLAGMRGLMTKPDGKIMETAITANFREGLSVMQYFLSTHGARKGLTDTALKTANSGYLTRRLVDVAQDVIVRGDDCGTTNGIKLRAVLMGGEVVVPIQDRILGRYLAAAVVHPQTNTQLYDAGTFISEAEATAIGEAGVDEVIVRSTITCENIHGVCVRCYGRDLGRGYVVRQGEAVGVIAAQSIGEPGTQLTMRTFHIGGAASREAVAHSVEAQTDGTLHIDARLVKNPQGHWVVVSPSGEMAVHDADGRVRERHLLQYGEVLYFSNMAKVKAGSQLSTRDSLVRPTITEYAGIVHIENLEEGMNATRNIDEMTGVESWTITEDKRVSQTKTKRRRHVRTVQVKLLDEKTKQPVKFAGTSGNEVSIVLQPGATLVVSEGAKVAVGDTIAKYPMTQTSRDITGGLPRVADLFEARFPQNPGILAKADGHVEFKEIQRHKQIINIVQDGMRDIVAERKGEVRVENLSAALIKAAAKDDAQKPIAITHESGENKDAPVVLKVLDANKKVGIIPGTDGATSLDLRAGETLYLRRGPMERGTRIATVHRSEQHSVDQKRTILVQDGMKIARGDEIVEGDDNPHEILATRGVEALAAHIVDEVQSVYRLQGVTINDKHIETIIRQMLRCVRVTNPGDSQYLANDELMLSVVLEENKRLRDDGKKQITYTRLLLGITKASLSTDSFISAASFQETARVLTEACIAGRRDSLRGLKENVIVGRLIPAGTGFVHYEKLKQRSSEEAEEILRAGLEENEAAEAAAAAAAAAAPLSSTA